MKKTGIVRNVDNLGRICLPKEIRRTFHIDAGTPIELSVDQDRLILTKYDAVGDMEQLLDMVESGIRSSETLLKPLTIHRLLVKVKEMKQILKE